MYNGHSKTRHSVVLLCRVLCQDLHIRVEPLVASVGLAIVASIPTVGVSSTLLAVAVPDEQTRLSKYIYNFFFTPLKITLG